MTTTEGTENTEEKRRVELKRLSQIARAVWRVPAIDWGFLQQCEALDHLPTTKDSRTGTRNHQDGYRTEFRVVVSSRGKTAEKQGTTLRPALCDALEAVGVSVPEELARMRQKIVDASGLPPRPIAEEKPEELEARKKQWEAEMKAMRETAGILEALGGWIAPIGGRGAVGGD